MTLRIDGVVTSGLGKGKEFVALDGYQSEFESKLGYQPYAGTLNLTVEEGELDELGDREAITLASWERGDASFGAVDCYPVSVPNRRDTESLELHAIVPRRTEHDDSVLELVAAVNLRDRFDLSDGSELVVVVDGAGHGDH